MGLCWPDASSHISTLSFCDDRCDQRLRRDFFCGKRVTLLVDTGGKMSTWANFCSYREQRAGFSVTLFQMASVQKVRCPCPLSSKAPGGGFLSPRPRGATRWAGRRVSHRPGQGLLWCWRQPPCPCCPFQQVILQRSLFFSITKLFCCFLPFFFSFLG